MSCHGFEEKDSKRNGKKDTELFAPNRVYI